ncbi:MAG: LCP family protein [Cyanobacteriota bacterium ELA615]
MVKTPKKIYSQPNDSKSFGNNGKSKTGNWFYWAAALLGLSVFSAWGGAFLAKNLDSTPLMQSALNTKDSSIFGKDSNIAYNGFQLPQFNRPVNILLLGAKVLASEGNRSDLIKNGYEPAINSFNGLTDSILLLHFDPQSHKTTIISVPRDTKVELPGRGNVKINEANQDGGAPLAATTVSKLLNGVEIDRYITINTLGLVKLIDILGGVTVTLPKDIKYKDDTQHLYVDFKAGVHHFNGAQSEQYLRFRHDELGDIGRIQRQQMFIRSLTEQALTPKLILKVPQILSLIRSHVDTNLTLEDIIALSAFAITTNRSDMQMVMLPGDFSGSESRISYWIPNYKSINKMVDQYLREDAANQNQSAIEPSKLRISIQDSTDSPQAVRSLEKSLLKAGYSSVQVYRRKISPLEKTKIVIQTGDRLDGQLLRNKLGIGEIFTESTGSLGSDITIQIGKDWVKQSS